jgi:hypothetical protein
MVSNLHLLCQERRLRDRRRDAIVAYRSQRSQEARDLLPSSQESG